jgi:hypothetical protein
MVTASFAIVGKLMTVAVIQPTVMATPFACFGKLAWSSALVERFSFPILDVVS